MKVRNYFKFITLSCIVILSACKEEKEMTVYDYLQNETKLQEVRISCKSGELRDEHKCKVVNSAYRLLDSYKHGELTEEKLREYGKK